MSVKFSREFLKELTKNFMETSNIFREKLPRIPVDILEIFAALLKICPEVVQSLVRHCTDTRGLIFIKENFFAFKYVCIMQGLF